MYRHKTSDPLEVQFRSGNMKRALHNLVLDLDKSGLNDNVLLVRTRRR